MRPLHLLDIAGAKTTLCGIKTKEPEALPFLLADHLERTVASHARAGRAMEVCAACFRSLRGE